MAHHKPDFGIGELLRSTSGTDPIPGFAPRMQVQAQSILQSWHEPWPFLWHSQGINRLGVTSCRFCRHVRRATALPASLRDWQGLRGAGQWCRRRWQPPFFLKAPQLTPRLPPDISPNRSSGFGRRVTS